MKSYSILFLNNKDIKNQASGGGTYLVFRLMKALARRGHSVTLVCGNYGTLHREDIDGIDVVRVGRRFTVYPSAILRYLRCENRKKHDLVVDCALQGIPFFAPLYVNRSSVIAVFFHLERDVFLTELPQEIGKIRGYVLGQIARTIEGKVVPALYKNTLKITFSESTRRDLITLGSDEQILVLQEGIDLSKYKQGAKGQRPSVVYLGRLKKYKGVQDALKAMKLVQEDIPEVGLSIVGRGDYEQELMKMSRNLGLETKVVFHGYVEESEKIKLLQRAHVLVMPSCKEGWATPVLEANACGTPAVVSNATGVKETVKHGETGFVYPLGDCRKMADYLKILLKDVALREQMSKQAIEWAQRFDWKLSESKFVSICEGIMNAHTMH